MSINVPLREYLLSRRSVTAPIMSDPGPDAGQLNELLTMASRVPDHGRLAPWRFVIYEGDARARAGEKLAEIAARRFPDYTEEQLETERKRFMVAPLTVGVLSTPKVHPKIPEFEQLLAAGNACLNLCHAANALGFGANWVTRWYAFDDEAAAMLGAEEGERFVGFVFVGTPTGRLEERPRPDVAEITTVWEG